MDKWDVIIAGAGIAGLAAGERLGKAGPKVLVLEARDRLGGRIFSLPGLAPDHAIELGAEFVHGRPQDFDEYLRRHGLDQYETGGQSYCSEDGLVRSCGGPSFEVLEKLYRLDPSTFADETFDKTLTSRFAGFPEREVDWARRYVQGFHAADTSRISTHSIIIDGRAEEQTDGERGFHIRGGYRQLIDVLSRELAPTVQVRTNTIVESIAWSDRNVTVKARSDSNDSIEFCSTRLVVALPLGVLQQEPPAAGAIGFNPPISAKYKSLQSMVMGSVQRLVLQFDEMIWEDINAMGRKTLPDLHFLFGKDAGFPTLWTAMPLRVPVLMAWAAGPIAQTKSGWSQGRLETEAVASLARTLFVPEERLRQRFVRSYYHDWQTDPFSRGAYSYVLAGGIEAQKELAKPLRDTIYFAGEATQADGHRATVHGAFASGVRAAEEIMAATGR